jgi:2,3,4,5-tetrahydropyridine-2-carboxylate N-succinyltransferase
MNSLQTIIEQAWENRALLQEETTTKAIREVIELLDAGKLRVAEPKGDAWQVNEWVKSCYVFSIQKMETWEAGIFEYHDKMELKKTMLLKEFV